MIPTTVKTPGTKGTPATVRCPEQLVCRLQSKPATVPASSGVANNIDRAKAGMPTTERQHGQRHQQQLIYATTGSQRSKDIFSYPRIFIRHRLSEYEAEIGTARKVV